MSVSFKFATRHWMSLLAGIFLLLCFNGLSRTRTGMSIQFASLVSKNWDGPITGGEAFTNLTAGEALFWLGYVTLILPGAALVGYGLVPVLIPLLETLLARLRGLTPRERIIGTATLFILCACLARLGHSVIALDYPVTDDEYAARFGGILLSRGRVLTPIRYPFIAFPSLFLYVREGFTTSMDWVGLQIAWAIGELIHAPEFVFALAAAIPVVCLLFILHSRLGLAWALFGAALFWISPLGQVLSWTTHVHILSRAAFAGFLLAYWWAWTKGGFNRWMLVGVAFGIGMTLRPFEIGFLTLPFLADIGFRAIRGNRESRLAVAAVAIGLLPGLLTILVHNSLVTGNPFMPARLAGSFVAYNNQHIFSHEEFNAAYGVTFTFDTLVRRFARNVGFNSLRLLIWFFGPLGLGLVIAGIGTDRFTKLLLGSLVLDVIVLGMLHNDFGVHVGGPHHQTECVVPLTILATHGLHNLFRTAQRMLPDARAFAIPVMTSLLVGALTFNLIHGYGIYRQALVQDTIHQAIQREVTAKGGGKAIILAPPFEYVWRKVPPLANIGTWINQWPPIPPDSQGQILVLLDASGVESELREQFPDRKFFRLQLPGADGRIIIDSLDGPSH